MQPSVVPVASMTAEAEFGSAGAARQPGRQAGVRAACGQFYVCTWGGQRMNARLTVLPPRPQREQREVAGDEPVLHSYSQLLTSGCQCISCHDANNHRDVNAYQQPS